MGGYPSKGTPKDGRIGNTNKGSRNVSGKGKPPKPKSK